MGLFVVQTVQGLGWSVLVRAGQCGALVHTACMEGPDQSLAYHRGLLVAFTGAPPVNLLQGWPSQNQPQGKCAQGWLKARVSIFHLHPSELC